MLNNYASINLQHIWLIMCVCVEPHYQGILAHILNTCVEVFDAVVLCPGGVLIMTYTNYNYW